MKSVDEKISDLLKRYLKPPSEEELDQACERNLQKFLAAAATMKHESASEPEMEWIEELRGKDFIVLTAVYLLRDEVHLDAVVDKANELAGKELHRVDVFVALVEMVDRGHVVRRVVPGPENNGRQKMFYKITGKGRRALAHARENAPVADYLRGWT